MKIPLFRQTLNEFIGSKTNWICLAGVAYNVIGIVHGTIDPATGVRDAMIAAAGMTIYDKMHGVQNGT